LQNEVCKPQQQVGGPFSPLRAELMEKDDPQLSICLSAASDESLLSNLSVKLLCSLTIHLK